jgi:hypothetical protein
MIYTAQNSSDFPANASQGDFCYVLSDNTLYSINNGAWYPVTEQTWVNGIMKSDVVEAHFSGVTDSNGQKTFYFTDNNASNGNPLFAIGAFPESLAILTPANAESLIKTFSIAEDGKSITVTVKKQSFTSANVLINLVGGLIGALTGSNYVAAPSVTIYLSIKGN